MRDRRDLDKGGGYASEVREDKQVRNIKGVDYSAKQQENTTPQTPGTGWYDTRLRYSARTST